MKKLVKFIDDWKESKRYTICSDEVALELEELVYRFIISNYPNIKPNKYVFVRCKTDIGYRGTELPIDINVDATFISQLEYFYPEEMI